MNSDLPALDLGKVHVLDVLGDVDTDMLRDVLRFDTAIRRHNANQAERAVLPRVLVRIASRGGDTDTGAAIHNALRLMPAEIITFGLAAVSSAAVIAFCSGNTRLLITGARVVYHAPTWNPEGSYTVEEQRRVLQVSERRVRSRRTSSRPHDRPHGTADGTGPRSWTRTQR